jgi:hypothetical protein
MERAVRSEGHGQGLRTRSRRTSVELQPLELRLQPGLGPLRHDFGVVLDRCETIRLDGSVRRRGQQQRSRSGERDELPGPPEERGAEPAGVLVGAGLPPSSTTHVSVLSSLMMVWFAASPRIRGVVVERKSEKKTLRERPAHTRHVVHGRAIPPARAACACVGRRAPAPARCVCLAAADRNSFSSPARSQHREGGRQHRDARPHDRRRSPMLRHGHGSRVHRPGIRRAARRHPRPVKLEHVLVNLEHVLVVLDDAVAAR